MRFIHEPLARICGATLSLLLIVVVDSRAVQVSRRKEFDKTQKGVLRLERHEIQASTNTCTEIGLSCVKSRLFHMVFMLMQQIVDTVTTIQRVNESNYLTSRRFSASGLIIMQLYKKCAL